MKYFFILTMIGVSFFVSHSRSQRSSTSFPYRFNCTGFLESKVFSPTPLPGDNGYRLHIVGRPQEFQPSRRYTVTLKSAFPASFRGFAIRATADDGSASGIFTPINTHLSQETTPCPNVITHASEAKKVRVQVLWTAPPGGCVRLSASVIKKGTTWYKDDGQLSLKICSEDAARSTSGLSAECCSCGSARYQMTFYGLWSPTTHPTDYPAFSTHWSNIIGASHSSSYVIWEYGGYASEGVQKVAEWGWTDNLEEEIRAQDTNDVLSIIKTKAQWPAFQPRNLKEAPNDEFEVDTDRHMVSLLTMMGPSPDWNVGLTRQSMCTEQCGWIGTRSFDMMPWDAGTDSGVTYMAANFPTRPHEQIRNLTSSDHPKSPFYDPNGGHIPPVARVVIHRLSLSGVQCGSSEAPLEEDVTPSLYGRSSNETPKTCVYSEWGDWSECGASCGWGIKTRSRMIKMSPSETSCESTMQKEICQGNNLCENSSDITSCLYSEWTTWSPCGSTCGNSLKQRSRVLKWPSEPQHCHEPLKEMSRCSLPACEACLYSRWSDWMRCPVTCGIGQTVRKRSLLSSNPECESFEMDTSQCMTSMTCESDTTYEPGCVYTPWSDWSSCPVTCGVGQSVRKKLLQSNTTSSCRDFVMETTKCMTSSSCPNECSYGSWTEWMPCSSTCGVGETIRKKFLTDSSMQSSDCDAFVMENAPCHNRPCHDNSTARCNYQPWSGWIPCSATCGKGETLRKRFLTENENSENCPGFEMEKNICMVTCSSVQTSSNCQYSDWSTWMPCSSSCKTFRKKLLQSASDPSNCKRVIKERKRCLASQCRRGPSCSLLPWSSWSECRCEANRLKKGFRTRQRNPAISSRIAHSCNPKIQRRRCVCTTI